jgi:hypothetical protein
MCMKWKARFGSRYKSEYLTRIFISHSKNFVYLYRKLLEFFSYVFVNKFELKLIFWKTEKKTLAIEDVCTKELAKV